MVTTREICASTRKKALDQLRDAGLSIPQWAAANGFSVATTKAVLYGHSKGLRGEAHRVAVALGIKSGVVVSAKGYQPVRRTKVPLKLAGGCV